MKTTTKVLLAGVLLAASSAPLVADAAVNFDVNIGVPGYSYYAPVPVYYYPPAYYTPAPRYYHHRDWDRRWERDHRYFDRRHEYFEHRHENHRRW